MNALESVVTAGAVLFIAALIAGMFGIIKDFIAYILEAFK